MMAIEFIQKHGVAVLDLRSLVDEYGDISASNAVGELVQRHDWTRDGATDLVELVEQYGWFFLRSACALAMAFDLEDGSKGH